MGNKKAVTITKDNQQQLIQRYGANQDDLEQFPVGFIMIANFGDNGDYRYEGVLTVENFNNTYVKGEALKNGFYEVRYK